MGPGLAAVEVGRLSDDELYVAIARSLDGLREYLLEAVRRGWTQSRIGAAMGLTQGRVSQRMKELDVQPKQPNSPHTESISDLILSPHPGDERDAEIEPRRNGNMGVHYSSATDEWATPPEFFAAVDAEFSFELDVCALPASAKCERYLTPEDDGLSIEWDGVCWMNPPYGDEIVKWVKKAHDSALDGATVVCLVPARVDTGWWWDYCRFGEIRFLRGRLKFGGSDTSAPFPSALVVFGRPACVKWWEWR